MNIIFKGNKTISNLLSINSFCVTTIFGQNIRIGLSVKNRIGGCRPTCPVHFHICSDSKSNDHSRLYISLVLLLKLITHYYLIRYLFAYIDIRGNRGVVFQNIFDGLRVFGEKKFRILTECITQNLVRP